MIAILEFGAIPWYGFPCVKVHRKSAGPDPEHGVPFFLSFFFLPPFISHRVKKKNAIMDVHCHRQLRLL